MLRILSITAALAAALSFSGADQARAEGFSPVQSLDRFVGLVSGRELRRFGITVSVDPGGAISGRAFGSDVSGNWTWNDGYFCRDLFWAGDDLGYNCQLVEVSGDTMRFTTDRGAGIYADLTLQ